MNLLLLFCNICIYDFACFVAHFGFARWIIKVKQNYKNLYVISSLWETHYILSPILNGLPNKVWLASKKSALIKIHEWINKTNFSMSTPQKAYTKHLYKVNPVSYCIHQHDSQGEFNY